MNRKQRRAVWSLGLAQSVDAGEDNAVSALYPAMARSLALNVGNLGVILAVNGVLQLIARPIWAMLADRYSRKAVLVWGTGVWGILTLLVGFATGYWQILALTVLSGIGLTARGGPQEALVADLFPREERGKAFGTIWSIASVGVVLSVLVLGILADVSEMGWRIAFLLFGGLSVLSGVIIWRYVDEPVRGQSEAAFVGVSSETVAKLEVQHPFSVSKIPDLFRVPTLVLDWLNTIPAQLRWVGIVRFGTVWLADDRGLSPGTALYALGSLTIGLGIGGFFGGRLVLQRQIIGVESPP